MEKPRDEPEAHELRPLMTVKEFAHVTRQHPLSVYRKIREGRQDGVHRFGGVIRLDPPRDV